ncbi:conserved hypothetical protein [Cellulomonas flavigena DSM 20109]|uniref:Uncharacterized protein n=1 Tax=Cellulomonas flavigena (strain ATCC 482 / DSM 20109 / BCRC 11376 / JCM 18109 / NBRC 3775 / NCIMB 8073 / NRS 134) TaxID=446466 RepID=D5UK78_CELFN|nr:conserved hypothetical protein [Cellulomonas flavigena DSM 20109]
MLEGLVPPVDAEPTVDAATYRTAFASAASDDPIAPLSPRPAASPCRT